MMKRSSNLITFAAIAVVGVVALFAGSRSDASASSHVRRSLQSSYGGEDMQMDNRPVMFTFYSPPNGIPDEKDVKLIEAWKESWDRSGWNTQVLSLSDVKTHPDFGNALKVLGITFSHEARLSFLKWFAMALVGGGWMCDYDTFPLHDFLNEGANLPNEGKLTVFDNTLPSLISGSASEWDRMAHVLLENSQEHLNTGSNDPWNDILALQDLQQKNSELFASMDDVLQGETALAGREVWRLDKECKYLSKGKRAVKFSNTAVEKVRADQGLQLNDRAVIAIVWLQMWREACTVKAELPVMDFSEIEASVLAQRPIIYTFYTGVEDSETSTRMTREQDEELVNTWKQAWTQAGWDARVLGIENAKYHPLFRELSDEILKLDLDDYNNMCLVRWIAMATQGGGWMTDYDTFPLNDFRNDGMDGLPFEGVLTVWNGYTPSLVSGIGHEWIRVLRRIIESIAKKGHKDGRRDIMALKHLHETTNGDMFRSRNQVLRGETVLTETSMSGQQNCEMSKGMRAVHFSHRAMTLGSTSTVPLVPADRASVAVGFLNTWNHQCQLSKVESV